MESNTNLLDTLTEQQQTHVYELMGIADIDDANVAAKLYIDSNYDLNRAVQRWFDRQASGRNVEPSNSPDILNNPSGTLRNPLLQPQTQAIPESELHTQYRRYLERKTREEEEKGITGYVKENLSYVFSKFRNIFDFFVPVFIRGEREGGEQFQRFLWRNHAEIARSVRFQYGTFQENAEQSVGERRPLLVFLQLDDEEHRNVPNNLFRHQGLVDFINNKFHPIGLLGDTNEGQKMTKFVEAKDWPFIGIFRVNLVGEPTLLESISIKRDSTPESVLEQLRNADSNFYLILGEEDNIKREVQRSINEQRRRNMHMNSPFSYGGGFQDEDENLQFIQQNWGSRSAPARAQNNQRLEEDRLLRQIQEEEFKEVERKIMEQQQKKQEEEKTNREKEELETSMRKQKEDEEKRRTEEKEMKKKTKLQTLPPEPAEDDQSAILIIFRLPNGDRLERRFNSNDKAQALYDYIDTKDVEFDASTKRYDLMQPRPFLCLDDLNKPVGEYFEGSNSEVITIREHHE